MSQSKHTHFHTAVPTVRVDVPPRKATRMPMYEYAAMTLDVLDLTPTHHEKR